MKIILRTIGTMLLLVSPLFSALLTDDLEVISPTGIPLSHDDRDQAIFTTSSNYVFTPCFIQGSMSILLVREYTKSGVIQSSQTIVDQSMSLIMLNTSSPSDNGEDMIVKNVILE